MTEILVLSKDELAAMIETISERTVSRAVAEFRNILDEQKDYYEQLLTASEIAADLQCSLESVYRYWRTGKLGYGQIKPSEKGSSKSQIADFRRSLLSECG